MIVYVHVVFFYSIVRLTYVYSLRIPQRTYDFKKKKNGGKKKGKPKKPKKKKKKNSTEEVE